MKFLIYLAKLKEILFEINCFIKTLITGNYRSWHSNSRLLDGIKIILKVINTSMADTLSFLDCKFNPSIKKSHLKMIIRKKAHFVEKLLFFPENIESSKEMDPNCNILIRSLSEWKKRKYKITNSIQWALNILNDYESSFPDKCPECRINPNNSNLKIDPQKVLNLIQNRRSRRTFLDKAIPEKYKIMLVDAALHAPSSCNAQPLRIIFIEDDNLKEIVSNSIKGGKVFFKKAPLIAIILVDKREYKYPDNRSTPYEDGAVAVENMLILAESMGLACCWGALNSYTSILFERRLRAILKIPECYLITGSIAIGYKKNDVNYIPRDNPKNRYSIDRF